jgi:SagB-type dehydrogenase family enzyme
MQIVRQLALVADASLATGPDGVTRAVHRDGREHALADLSPAQAAALQCLVDGDSVERIRERVADASLLEKMRLEAQLQELVRLGLVEEILVADGQPLLSRRSVSPHYQRTDADAGLDYVLSRFACLRREGRSLVLESPRSFARVTVADVSVLPHLHGSESTHDADLPQAVALFLAEVEMMVPVDAEGVPAEETNDALRQWEFHDLLFHERSHAGRHDYPFGPTRRFAGEIEHRPALKAPMSEEIVQLATADIETLTRHDTPFTAVVEARRSLRDNREAPITLCELGEFLYRTARVRDYVKTEDYTRRVYPAGGSAYELELYVIVGDCSGLARGIYHYDPLGHQLEKTCGDGDGIASALDSARRAQRAAEAPPLLVVATSRLPRLSWIYASIAYNLTLQNLGHLWQTMYLVATAMGLNPCAIGSGDSVYYEHLLGINSQDEVPVGWFTLR